MAESGLIYTLNLTLLWLTIKKPAVMAVNWWRLVPGKIRSVLKVRARPVVGQKGQMLTECQCVGTRVVSVHVLVRLNYTVGM